METSIIIVIVGLLVTGTFLLIFISTSESRRLTKKPKQKSLIEAEKLFEQKQYQLAVIKAYSSIESALKNSLKQSGSSFDLLLKAERKGLFSKQFKDDLHELRKMRNKLAHGDSTFVSKNHAAKHIDTARKANSRLRYDV